MKRISEHDLHSLTSALTHLENFVFLESSKVSENDHHSMLFTDPLDWLVCTAEGPVELFLEQCEKWQPEAGYWLLEEHLQRLTDSASYFQFSFDVRVISQTLTATAVTFTTPHNVRLLLYRDGGLEITTTELPNSRISDPLKPVLSAPLPMVAFSRQQTNPDSRYLFHKTTMRKTYDDGRKFATKKQLFEILFTNDKYEVTEGSISNIFIERDGMIFTPPRRCGLLNGTFRRFLLDHGTVQERVLSRQDIASADAVYVGNSIRGLVQVTVRPEDC